MKIAITGGTGQIGVTLVKQLISKGHTLKLLIFDGDHGVQNLPVEFCYGSVWEESVCDRLVQDADIVFHLAAQVSIDGDPDGTVWRTNVEGTRNILNACVKHNTRKLIHFSSIHAYCAYPLDSILDETRALAGSEASAYARSKAEGQRLVLQYVALFGLNATILNPTAVLGPEDHLPSIKGKMLLGFFRSRIPALLPGGYDWVDTRDVVNAAIEAMYIEAKGECYLLSGKYYTMRQLADIIHLITGIPVPRFTIPGVIMKLIFPLIRLWSKITKTQPLYTLEALESLEEGRSDISCSKAAKTLNFRARAIDETITETYRWFLANGYVTSSDETYKSLTYPKPVILPR